MGLLDEALDIISGDPSRRERQRQAANSRRNNGRPAPVVSEQSGYQGNRAPTGAGWTGDFTYISGTLTSGSLTGVGPCIGIRLFASGGDATCDINGGQTITVRAGTGADINPQGQVVAPVVNWLSGTLDVVILGLS